MIQFTSHTLENGLTVIVHEDFSTPLAVLNVLYDVGSRDEEESMTGFAHLFEHLMFSGSVNIPSYDEPLQRVGGENNAFTSPDITNYYLSVPAVNIETGFWLESDRMLNLAFSENGLEVQRKVVIEEFKQRYLNQPYGDVWLKMKPEIYTVHPYKWLTIGKEIAHVENARMEDVRQFFDTHYKPNNAILVIAGSIKTDEAIALAEKWFGPIPSGPLKERNLPQEPRQTQARHIETTAPVPLDALFKAYHMCSRRDPNYHTADLLSDVLGRDKSSRLYEQLVKKQKLFNSINAHVTGSLDPGLLVIQGHLNEGVTLEAANEAVEKLVQELIDNPVEEKELQKVKNLAETSMVFEEIELLNRAMNLAFHALLGDPNGINLEPEKVQAVTAQKLQQMATEVLRKDNCTTLFYRADKQAAAALAEAQDEEMEQEEGI